MVGLSDKHSISSFGILFGVGRADLESHEISAVILGIPPAVAAWAATLLFVRYVEGDKLVKAHELG